MSANLLAQIQLACCLLMTGLIWTIQLVHYPFFQFTDEKEFQTAHTFHSNRISIIVIPVMVIELIVAIALAVGWHSTFWGINLFLVVLIWLSTFFLSVPLHNSLGGGKNNSIIARLVATNWPRTLLWSLRSCLIFWFLNLN